MKLAVEGVPPSARKLEGAGDRDQRAASPGRGVQVLAAGVNATTCHGGARPSSNKGNKQDSMYLVH